MRILTQFNQNYKILTNSFFYNWWIQHELIKTAKYRIKNKISLFRN